MTDFYDELLRILDLEPVIGDFHPLIPLCLPSDVEVLSKAETFAYQLDDLSPHPVRPVLISTIDSNFSGRFYKWDQEIKPSAQMINMNLPCRIDYARNHMLTHQGIKRRIINDLIENDYQTIALVLVDGLSYDDSLLWPEKSTPCFVDGPTITFSRTVNRKIMPDVGLPAIIGKTPLARNLVDIGMTHSRGYSYWSRDQNDVSEYLFRGVPLKKVEEFNEAIALLSNENLNGCFIQLIREGLDGLAHRRRELNEDEVVTTIKSIFQDLLNLVDVIYSSGLRGGIYLTSDHGILWKNQHDLKILPQYSSRHPRYALENEIKNETNVTKFAKEYDNFYLFNFPYLGSKIKTNDCGVHGGLSYWESLVPFIHIEVNL